MTSPPTDIIEDFAENTLLCSVLKRGDCEDILWDLVN